MGHGPAAGERTLRCLRRSPPQKIFAADARASAQRRPIPDEEDVPDMRPSGVQRSTDVSKASEHGSDTENHASIRGTHVFVRCVD